MTAQDDAREQSHPTDVAIERERETLVQQLGSAVERVMVLLSAIWIALLVAELAAGPLPASLEMAVWVIWGIFIVHFLAEFVIAPAKVRYLRSNWLTALSLVLPAVRFLRAFAALRVLRAARVVRSVGLLRMLTSINRGMASLRATAASRGLGYVVAATVLIVAVGAAGMAWFESPASLAAEDGGSAGAPLDGYAEALWWTLFAMTTGATSQPVTGEGRLLGWLLSLYGLGVFGYLTAVLASHFVGRERGMGLGPIAALRSEGSGEAPHR
jgi:voltage-gated potassium channel